jgi:hypothetical protein
MIHEMKRLAVPAVDEAGGILVKAEADNLYCLFEDVDAAIGAAREILRRLGSQCRNAQDRHWGGDRHRLRPRPQRRRARPVRPRGQPRLQAGRGYRQEGEILLTAAATSALVCGFAQRRADQHLHWI